VTVTEQPTTEQPYTELIYAAMLKWHHGDGYNVRGHRRDDDGSCNACHEAATVALEALAAAGRLLPEGASSEPFKTWYRSLTPGGQLWCESSDPDEVARMSAGTGCTFERLEIVTVTLPWRTWVPPVHIDEAEESADE
jgi:hypothetical protein